MKFTEQKVKELIEPIKLVKVESIIKHEGADRLYIIRINDGGNGVESDKFADIRNEDGTIQIVTAANNFTEGNIVPWLAPGNVVSGWLLDKGEEIRLESRAMRGETSHGMILAKDEIGIGTDHDGIFVVEGGDELIGKSILEVLVDVDWNEVRKNPNFIEITPEIQHKIDLLKSIAEDGGELVGEEQLAEIFTSGEELFTYDGFEPSGQMHIAQGIIRAINTNKMIEAGFTFRMWVADWFGYLNNKMGGDMEKIRKVGEYFIEIWRACGMNLDGTEFLWTSDFINKGEYWENVMKISRSASLNRLLRTTEIMGRKETDDLTGAQIIYPCMQVTDIFYVMKCQVTQLGMDQRKVNMLAREVGEELGFWKPVVLSHGMLQGLQKPLPQDVDATERAISMKMSKSMPDTALFMTDSEEDVKRKIIKAYCPEKEVKDNPILGYCKQIIFQASYLKRDQELLTDGKFVVDRDEKFGGNVEYSSYEELEEAFKSGDLFPLDLKNAVIKYLNELLRPVREHFENDPKAKALLEEVKTFQITR